MNWGYVTGYFDGEGTVGLYRKSATRNGMSVSLSWCNTHRESLEALQAFIECGVIRERRHVPRTKPFYALYVERRADLMRIIPLMLPHSIIKAEKLSALLAYITTSMRDAAPGYGSLRKVGPIEIRRLYWEECLTAEKIGAQYGVTGNAVKNYMHRHGIPLRDRVAAGALIHWSSEAVAKQSERVRARRLAQWQDPEYRARMTAAIRAGQTKRIAALKAGRAST